MSSNPLSERLRFAEFVLDRLPNGRCRARVALTWRDSEAFSGESEGLASQAGELRCAAEACVKAGHAIERSEVRLPGGPIRMVGEHAISLHLHSDFDVPVTLTVVAEE